MHRMFDQLAGEYDVLVCGGGVYGAWTAYDAALRGLKVALIDKGDWASATSSASSKLIHGGLRYLESFDVKLVKKSLAERQMLLTAAPHLVQPLRFGIPVYQQNRFRAITLKIGLALYDYLADLPNPELKHRYHSKREFLKHFPCLDQKNITGGFTYFDAQTDDARFVIELIEGAVSAGATCVNYCELVTLHETNGLITHATVSDQLTQATKRLKARHFVDTLGRWSFAFQAKASSPSRLTKGIHLIMPNIVLNEALLLNAKSDNRVFFIIPWQGLTLLGTTDTPYDGNLNHLGISDQDINYLLDEANRVLYPTQWAYQDILGKFAGIRVLPADTNAKPSAITREWSLREQPNQLLSSIGGKFTSAREDASVIVDKICERMAINQICQTFGKPFPRITGTSYQSLLDNAFVEARHLNLKEATIFALVNRYGTLSGEIFRLCEQETALASQIHPPLPFIFAELIFCARHEMVVHLDDLLRRRLPILILATLTTSELQAIATFIAPHLGWNNEKISQEIERCIN